MRTYANVPAILAIAVVILLSGCRKNVQDPLLPDEKNLSLVSLSEARSIAEEFNPNLFYDLSNAGNKAKYKSPLTGNNVIQSVVTINDHSAVPALYVFNYDQGFLIVSADHNLEPIQAFVEKGSYGKTPTPEGAGMWLKKTVNNIEALRKGLYDHSKLAKIAWRETKAHLYPKRGTVNQVGVNIMAPPTNPCDADPNYSSGTMTSVGPLIATNWGQGCGYNDLVPDIGCSYCGNRPPTGCVATAMAQVIAYWQYPTGTYNYSAMQPNWGEVNTQMLMRDAGQRLLMQYGCSGSHPPVETYLFNWHLNTPTYEYIIEAFKNGGGYGFTYGNANGQDYSHIDNYGMVQTDIFAYKPIIFTGNTNDEGHCWVCDGACTTDYQWCVDGTLQGESTLSFHMNWGWDGYCNGWFSFANWYIPQVGYNFQYYNEIVYNIHP